MKNPGLYMKETTMNSLSRLVACLLLGTLPLLFGCSKSAEKKDVQTQTKAAASAAKTSAAEPAVPKPAAPVQKTEVRIGAVLPLSGEGETIGKSIQNGIQLAVGEINKISRTLQISVDIQDDASQEANAVALMEKFCSVEKVPVVIGEVKGATSLAMAALASQFKVVQIAPASTSPMPAVTEGGDCFFRTSTIDTAQATAIAQWMLEIGMRKAGVLFVNDPWGTKLKDQFFKDFEGGGGIVVGLENCEHGDTDFKEKLTSLIASRCDAFYMPTPAKEGGPILNQLRGLENNNPRFGPVEWYTPDLRKNSGWSSDGAFFLRPEGFQGPDFDSFMRRYKDKYMKNPDPWAANAYDIVKMLERAFNAGKTTGPDVQEYLLKMPPYKGIAGTLQFDQYGNCVSMKFVRQTLYNGNPIDITATPQ